jgi:signal transduction histidine kinase
MTSDEIPDQEVQIILRRLGDIASAVTKAVEAQSYEAVLERIAHVARELVGAKFAALGIPDGEGGLTYFKVSGMLPGEIRLIDHLPVGRGLIGAIMRESETIRLPHIAEDPRSIGFPDNHPHMDRFLGTPLRVGDELYGMLYLCDRHDDQPFNQRDAWLVETLAGYAALAIAGSRLREHEGRLALLEERGRISMELHDGVIQSLYAVGMYLDLQRGGARLTPDALTPAIEDLNHIIDDIRSYIMNLKRDDAQHQTVRACLYDLVRRLHVPASIRVEIEAPDSAPLFSASTFDAICQIINEAISNAVRHASASEITITALQNANLLLVIVRDDGLGFDPKRIETGEGLGLPNIRQRASLYGGQVHIESAPGKGTRVTLSMPVVAG